jgi:ATP-dependent exoDNAse (exonuclease V) beta subunit
MLRPMTERAPADQAARDRALDVATSFIVQAPAGSGKTELLIQRCLGLLATVAEPECVLAITFTRKAAAEMRERILGALREARTPGTSDRELHPRTRELATAALAADARRGWRLLENPSRLRIQTIDALNLGLARRLPMLSGLGAGLGVEEHADELYRRAAEKVLAHLTGDTPARAQAIAEVLAHLDNRVPAFVDLVVQMLRGREAWLPLLPGGLESAERAAAVRTRLESARATLVQSHLASLRRAFPDDLLRAAAAIAREAARGLQGQGQDSPITAWSDTLGVPDTALRSVALWAGIAELLLTQKGPPRKDFNKKQGFPAGPGGQAAKARATALCAQLLGHHELLTLLDDVRRLPAPGYEEREWVVLEALLTVLRLAVAELELTFGERRVADYPRFAAAARDALGEEDAPTDTALALDARLRHVLVDEFQDTSDAQVRLLRKLTMGWQPGDGRSLFLVGDPMQSIYRFRDAEVGLFLDVRDHGLAGLPLEFLRLSVNFRSNTPIVDWINEVFPKVLPPRDDVQRGAVSYARVASRPGAAQDGGVRVHALLRRSPSREASDVADVVSARLAATQSGRVAILVQGRAHLVHIVAELTRRGLVFQATDIDPLGERPIVLDLLALTRALSHLGDRTAWLTALRAPWCGLTLADLHALVADAPEQSMIDLLRDPARRAAVEALSRARLERTWMLLEQALTELRQLGLRDTVERLWLALGGPATAQSPRSLDEAEAFLDALADFEAREGGPADLAALSDALERLYAPSRPSADIRVELLTIHKAKGLQFDTVIVPGLERLPRGDDKRLLRWLSLVTHDDASLVVAPLAQSGGARNVLYEWLKRLERDKLLQERRRLLYVAVTRAERWLHLFGSCTALVGESGPQLRRPAQHSLLRTLWPVVESEYLQRLAEAGAAPGADEPAVARDAPLRRLPSGWRPPAPAPAPRIKVRAAAVSPAATAVAFDWASETARHVGTVVHRELQRLGASAPLPSFDPVAAGPRWLAELEELGVPAGHRPRAIARVIDAVRATLSHDRGRWLLDASHLESATELALTGRIDGELSHVVIDRSFIAAGVRWVVDYKTSPHEGGGIEEFLDRERQRYRGQLARYAQLARHLGPQPVRVGLYFPLHGGWREWDPG